MNWDGEHRRRCTAWDAEETGRRCARINTAVAKAKALRASKNAQPKPTRMQRIVAEWENTLKAERAAFALAALGAAGVRYPESIELRMVGEMTSETEIEIVSALRGNPCADEITITIDSQGGSGDVAERIFGALRFHPAQRKTAVIDGRCYSAAITVILACNRVVATPESTFLIHKTEAPGEADPARREEICYRSDVRELWAAKASGVDLARYKAARDSMATLDAADALDVGLIHEIVDEADLVALPSTFEVETVDGSVVQFPLNRGQVRMMAMMMRNPSTSSVIFGLPSVYMAIASRLALGSGT